MKIFYYSVVFATLISNCATTSCTIKKTDQCSQVIQDFYKSALDNNYKILPVVNIKNQYNLFMSLRQNTKEINILCVSVGSSTKGCVKTGDMKNICYTDETKKESLHYGIGIKPY